MSLLANENICIQGHTLMYDHNHCVPAAKCLGCHIWHTKWFAICTVFIPFSAPSASSHSKEVLNVLKNSYIYLGEPTIAGEYCTSFIWDCNISWLKVPDSSVQSFLKWLKWIQLYLRWIGSHICAQSGRTITRIWLKTPCKLDKKLITSTTIAV